MIRLSFRASARNPQLLLHEILRGFSPQNDISVISNANERSQRMIKGLLPCQVFSGLPRGEIYKKGCAQRHTPFYYRSIFLFLGSAKLGCHLSEMVGLGTHAHGHCHATFGFLGGSFGSFLCELCGLFVAPDSGVITQFLIVAVFVDADSPVINIE